jgi:signal transduction histidine kinase
VSSISFFSIPPSKVNMGIRILVADDEPDIVLGLSHRLEWLGHTVATACDGHAALTVLESQPVDLVFLDLEMPRLNGIEALRRITQRWPDLPVMILTAHGTVQLAVEAMQDGAVDFLTKPFESAQLESVVAKALERTERKYESTRLLGEISHDVKNLVMPLVTGTDLLADEINDLFKKLPDVECAVAQNSHNVCDEVIEILRRTSSRIQAHMKGIADYVAVSRSPQQFESCQISTVAESVANSLRLLVHQKNIVLRIEGLDTLPPIMADQNRLYSALYNLVHNAIPEVPSEGSITIRGCYEAADDSIVLTVQDTGRGMSPEVRDSLFTSRVISRKPGGTGLGTRIVKDVVDAHRGQIAVESQEGNGSKFVIRLPLHASAFRSNPVPSA